MFRRARAGVRNGVDQGAKHSRSSGYGEHLQRGAAPFRAHERVWRNTSQALSHRLLLSDLVGAPALELTNSCCRTDPAFARAFAPDFARVVFLSDNRAKLPRLHMSAAHETVAAIKADLALCAAHRVS